MMLSYFRRTISVAVILTAGFVQLALAAGDSTSTAPAYAWVDLSACQTPRLAPPPLPRQTDLVYNVQRRFVDLDRNGRCVVMDIWLERLDGMPDSVSRNLVRHLYRFDGKRWAEFIVPELTYYPYALQAPDGATVFILAAVDDDVGDQIVLGDAAPSVYQSSSGQKGLFGPDGYSLTPYGGDTRPVFRALAQQLSERLASGQLVKEELLTVLPRYRASVEKKRIAMLMTAAALPAAAASGPTR